MNLQTYKIFNSHYALMEVFGEQGRFLAYGYGWSVQEAIAGAFANYYYRELNG